MSQSLERSMKEAIRSYPDFPEKGILFRDFWPIFSQPQLCRSILEQMARLARAWEVQAIAGTEARGFLFGSMLATELELPFLPLRKAGKLPRPSSALEYDLEYGRARLEVQPEPFFQGRRVLIHDDLLATGGTALASSRLLEQAGLVPCGFIFLMELVALKGRNKLTPLGLPIHTLAKYD